jgi:hypothetical protein
MPGRAACGQLDSGIAVVAGSMPRPLLLAGDRVQAVVDDCVPAGFFACDVSLHVVVLLPGRCDREFGQPVEGSVEAVVAAKAHSRRIALHGVDRTEETLDGFERCSSGRATPLVAREDLGGFREDEFVWAALPAGLVGDGKFGGVDALMEMLPAGFGRW